MKLDFNFNIMDFRGNIGALGKEAMITILESSLQSDENYLDKTKVWGKSLVKDGTIDCDIVDARQLKLIVLGAHASLAFAKIELKDFIQKRIDSATKT